MTPSHVFVIAATVAAVISIASAALMFALGFGVGVLTERRKRPGWTARSATEAESAPWLPFRGGYSGTATGSPRIRPPGVGANVNPPAPWTRPPSNDGSET